MPEAPPSFPRLSARTQRFTLGVPRALTVAPDGSRVAFLRAPSGTDRSTCLEVLDLATGEERRVADPRQLLGAAEEELAAEERARRERAREAAGGIVAYATDRAVRRAAFPLSGQVWLADLAGDAPPRLLPTATPASDPRLSPDGRHVAYVNGGALRVVAVDGSGDRALAEPTGTALRWGVAEFVAAEEMGRSRGFWWGPDAQRLLVARVDESGVDRWHIAEPSTPATPPTVVAYPAAGTANADVTLHLLGLDGSSAEVGWDRVAFPYVTAATWTDAGLLVAVQARDQRRLRVLDVDPANGATTLRREVTDQRWVELVPGTPALTASGRLVTVEDSGDTRRLVLDGSPVTPDGLQVSAVLDVDVETVLFAASDEPTETHVWASDSTLQRVSSEPGVHGASRAGGVTALRSSGLAWEGVRTRLLRDGVEVASIPSRAEPAPFEPQVRLLRLGPRALRAALVLPRGHVPGTARLPVVVDSYAGPHALRVVAARSAHLGAQWLADQGFAVLVVDGRGTPGRGPEWERAVAGDLAGPVLADQVDALHAAAAEQPDLDLTRVAIRGWSFGGYLAALGVLRRPDVFAAAVAGAPVTDWRLYDTHYTERYLGDPAAQPAAYSRSSLLDGAVLAAGTGRVHRPLMLVHGLADDNVVAAHTLRLSAALLAAGYPHTVLPLSGVTHMTPQEHVAENLLVLQVDFLRRALDA